jgi:hypothetical protein
MHYRSTSQKYVFIVIYAIGTPGDNVLQVHKAGEPAC